MTKVVLLAAIICTTVAIATADESLPKIDVPKHCSDRARAMGDLDIVKKDSIDGCVQSEQEARTALVAAWKDIPARHKASCIKPNAYSPSYVEWISCLEMYIDLKNLHLQKQQ